MMIIFVVENFCSWWFKTYDVKDHKLDKVNPEKLMIEKTKTPNDGCEC